MHSSRITLFLFAGLFATGCLQPANVDLPDGTPEAQGPAGGGSPPGTPPGTGPSTPGGPTTPGTTPGLGSGGTGGGQLSACTSCKLHVPASVTAGTPAPLIVTLHGDEGRDGIDAASTMSLGLWKAGADATGFIVLSVACPPELGCNGAWSDWLGAQGYNPPAAALQWLDKQVDELEQKYNIDKTREFLGGHSGGAYWLSAYGPARSSRFAGVAFVAGGMPAYHALVGCPPCKQPGYFLGGDKDPRTGQAVPAPNDPTPPQQVGQMSQLASRMNACGQPLELDLVMSSAGFDATHENTIGTLASGRAQKILGWFLTRPLACN